MGVQRCASHALAEQERFMPEERVALLELVSRPLRMEVHFELYMPVLHHHPFFCRYAEMCAHVMRRVCHICCSVAQASPGDVIFSAGEQLQSPLMYFICSGKLDYHDENDNEETVHHGGWVSEAPLWTQWVHRGFHTATDNCRLCLLDAQEFQQICSSFEHPPSCDPSIYAQHFVKVLNEKLTEAEEDITDLFSVSLPSRTRSLPDSMTSDLAIQMEKAVGRGAGRIFHKLFRCLRPAEKS